jgi:hypothetical protein
MPIFNVASQPTSSFGSIPGRERQRHFEVTAVRFRAFEIWRKNTDQSLGPPSSNRLQPLRSGQYSEDKITSLAHAKHSPMCSRGGGATAWPTLQWWLARPNSLSQVDPGDPWLRRRLNSLTLSLCEPGAPSPTRLKREELGIHTPALPHRQKASDRMNIRHRQPPLRPTRNLGRLTAEATGALLPLSTGDSGRTDMHFVRVSTLHASRSLPSVPTPR